MQEKPLGSALPIGTSIAPQTSDNKYDEPLTNADAYSTERALQCLDLVVVQDVSR